MKKFTLRNIKTGLFFLALVIAVGLKAQPTITFAPNQACWNTSNYAVTASVTATIPGATSYTWAVTGPCSATQLSAGSNTASFNFTCAGNYTVNCFVYNSSNVLINTLSNVCTIPPPIVLNVSSLSGTVCPNTLMTVTVSGAASYTWNNGSTGSASSYNLYPGANIIVIGTATTGCTGTATVALPAFYSYPSISITGPFTVCAGSSAILSANGAVSYTWSSPAANTSSVSVMPNSFGCTQYTVFGTTSLGCVGAMTAFICVDTTCANVWPGDANSDGLVDNTDVLEIGLSYSGTGPARGTMGNTYAAHFATTWMGNGSTGKNKVHIDCNGDGTIDLGDTLAIYNNYSLTHAFKSSESASPASSDISLVVPANVPAGAWAKADIMLGSSSSVMSQLYGVAFDINYDNSKIETNSVYVVYTSSFLNASSQNVQFRKPNFTSGKLYAASVRTAGNDVSGNGKIGEFWFKAKTGLTAGSVLNLSTSNSVKISKAGSSSVLTNGSAAPTIVANAVGLKENVLENAISYFPNPASGQLTLKSNAAAAVNFVIYDIVGRELVAGTFTDTAQLDISGFQNGSYIIRFGAGSETSFKKLVIKN